MYKFKKDYIKWVKINRKKLRIQQLIWYRKNKVRLGKKRRERYWNNRKEAIKAAAIWKRANRGTVKKQSRANQYKISIPELRQLLKLNPICCICKIGLSNKDKHIDHDHSTGLIRGILCITCNTGLGSFKDNPNLLDSAKRYVSAA